MRTALLIGAAGAAWLLPYGLDSYAVHVADIVLIFCLLAVGLGLAMGIGGQVNLAQIAFFGVGAYVTAILTTRAGLGFWLAAGIAVLASAAIGLLVSTPALRVQSHYLGIVTLGLALAFTNWVTNAEIAGGAEGIPGIPAPTFPGADLSNEYLYYYLELIVFGLGLAFGLFVVRTSLGRRLRAMRDDALAAGALGADVPVLRMTAFLLAGVYGGVAGILYAGLIRYVAPESFGIATMFLLLAMVIIGGRQSLLGCVTGAIVLSLLRELLIDYPTYAQIAYGTVVVLTVVFAPTGLAGLPRRWSRFVPFFRFLFPYAPPITPSTQEAAPPPADLSPGPVLLEIAGVGKDFRGLRALDDVSLTVAAGEIRGVVGPNGSGKTTLFNVISGFYRPTTGRVRLAERDVTGLAPYRLSRLGTARTFQNLRLFGDLTVRENLLVALDRTRTLSAWRYLLAPIGVLRRDRVLHRRAAELLAAYDLAPLADQLPRSLPYGTQRRVEIARAMATAPRLLLLDEPAAGLNGEEVHRLAATVRAIRDSGVTVVIIEHNMSLVMSLCDRITVLAGGRVIAEGTPAEVALAPPVIEAYLGDSMTGDDLPTEVPR
ncbi:branched-chain amino acid ABC transporter ATP-binding protein/permease [Actinoplanes sp. NPDC051851]|uniref:branched-chain amino acid ABC transporter ATP-binding protein/permease n=1 Tax=Actinoplanes sp. NPDC051851 TaxID=3154753 RepID=UPI00341233A7